MVITIHQPEHLPWLGLFNKIAKVETFIILDSVQYEKNYFQNRNRILGTNGVQWMNIPVSVKGHMEGSIASTEISLNPANWRDKYIQTIKQSYGKYPYFDDVFPIIEGAIRLNTNLLAEINIAIIKGFNEKLEIVPEYIRSSKLAVSGFKSDLILNICKAVKANVYIAGPSGRDYLDIEAFKHNNIYVKFNDFNHPVYTQKRTKEFLPYLSAVDLFMNCGFEESKKIIMDGNEGINDY